MYCNVTKHLYNILPPKLYIQSGNKYFYLIKIYLAGLDYLTLHEIMPHEFYVSNFSVVVK